MLLIVVLIIFQVTSIYNSLSTLETRILAMLSRHHEFVHFASQQSINLLATLLEYVKSECLFYAVGVYVCECYEYILYIHL